MSRIDEDAARWVARLNGDASAEDRVAFDAWYAADPRHQGAYLRAEAAWTMLDRAEVMAHGDPERAQQALDRTVRTARSAMTRRYAMGAGMAASVAVAVAIGFALKDRLSIATRLGELRSVPLQDRSVAAVNTDSRIDVDMTSRLRHVALVKGEAWFEVAKNPEVPFVVSAGDIRVRAVGTAFSVRRRAGGADVLVTEGTVETWTVHDTERRVTLTAGHEAFMPETPQTVAVTFRPDDVERRLAWRTREIVLNSETLREAVAEFNRYNARQIIIADPAIGSETLVGGFHVDQPDTFARAVHGALNVPVSIGDDRIIIGTAAATS
ncbi:FecR family protein [Asticcacaulis sp. 201]|uniref:FecR family protein n=1 Tax=Asticcacaulis sp. 201 TaxID=3028787 RepID=UPI002916C1B7|nr:FecR domain-containing protein [Asticcacaulis sp. 201]MDV6330232.1 FecR domain-containing protein [Asticcacaulis sp. 201]